MADVIENAGHKRGRIKYSKEQAETLEQLFQNDHYPSTDVQEKVARDLGVTLDRIGIWFQNRRSKFKRQQQADHVAWMRKQIFQNEAGDEMNPLIFGTPVLPALTSACHVLSPLESQMCRGDSLLFSSPAPQHTPRAHSGPIRQQALKAMKENIHPYQRRPNHHSNDHPYQQRQREPNIDEYSYRYPHQIYHTPKRERCQINDYWAPDVQARCSPISPAPNYGPNHRGTPHAVWFGNETQYSASQAYPLPMIGNTYGDVSADVIDTQFPENNIKEECHIQPLCFRTSSNETIRSRSSTADDMGFGNGTTVNDLFNFFTQNSGMLPTAMGQIQTSQTGTLGVENDLIESLVPELLTFPALTGTGNDHTLEDWCV